MTPPEEFRTAMRGYEKNEVDARIGQLQTEIDSLRKALADARSQVITADRAKLQIAGLNTGYDRTVLRAGQGDHCASVWYYRQGRLIAVDALNDARAYMIGKRLIEAGRSPDPDLIADAPDLKALMT